MKQSELIKQIEAILDRDGAYYYSNTVEDILTFLKNNGVINTLDEGDENEQGTI